MSLNCWQSLINKFFSMRIVWHYIKCNSLGTNLRPHNTVLSDLRVVKAVETDGEVFTRVVHLLKPETQIKQNQILLIVLHIIIRLNINYDFFFSTNWLQTTHVELFILLSIEREGTWADVQHWRVSYGLLCSSSWRRGGICEVWTTVSFFNRFSAVKLFHITLSHSDLCSWDSDLIWTDLNTSCE